MKAKLFDAHNNLIKDHDTPEALPVLTLTEPELPPVTGSYQPPAKTSRFRLMDTDEAGTLIYREIVD